MKIRFAVLGAALLAFASFGCSKTDSKAKIEKDGSGSITQTTTIDLEKLKQLKALFMGMQGGDAEPAGMADPSNPDADLPITIDDIKASVAAVEGLKVVKAEQERSKDGKSLKMTIEVAFADLSLLTKANVMPNVELAKNPDGTWTLSYDNSIGTMGFGDGKGGGEMPFDPTTFIEQLGPYLGDFSVSMTLVLPGTVVDTNGTKAEDGSVSWKLGLKDVASSKALAKVTFKGDDLALQPFKAKMDPKKVFESMGKKRAAGGAKPGGAVPPPEKPPEPAPTPPEQPK